MDRVNAEATAGTDARAGVAHLGNIVHAGPAAASPFCCSDHLVMPHTDRGLATPRIGFGVYKVHPQTCEAVVLAALEAGYRHIDCAQLYRSEAEVAAALRQSGVPRRDVFLTTKIKQWKGGSDDALYENLLSSVRRLGGYDGEGITADAGEESTPAQATYVDLFLVHTPRFQGKDSLRQVWMALEKLKEQGRTRAIGVSNFGIRHLEEMKAYTRSWPPNVNQIELHPWCQQRELVKYCQDNNIVIQAYSPLATGTRLADPTIRSVAEKHKRSPAQVLIRYSLQKGWVPLPKTEHPGRMRENLDVFTFELDNDDMQLLDDLDEAKDGAMFPANVTE